MVDGRLVLVVVLVYARWNTYEVMIALNSLSCVMLRTRYGMTHYGV